MGPSGIRRNQNVPLRTRTLPNGTLVVENAYEGTLYYGDVPVAEIKRLNVSQPATVDYEPRDGRGRSGGYR
jgi:hypothetical protein